MQMFRTNVFMGFYRDLRDPVPKAKITKRLERLEAGNPGDVKAVGHGLSEMRIDHGPGYRVYFKRRGLEVVIILCGGDKTTQQAHIKQAAKIAEELEQR